MERMLVSIVIKALNEEKNIANCLESIINLDSKYLIEIILVDSISIDRTIDIAKEYPVKIIQFSDPDDVSCGAAVQLGYQHSNGEFLLLLDADMQICPGFLEEAVQFLKSNPAAAGVGGRLIDFNTHSIAELRRRSDYDKINNKTEVSHLGGGGLYKREHIEKVEYLSNTILKANEELELGLRLRANHFKLYRLPIPSVKHRGHHESEFSCIKRLYNNGRFESAGHLFINSINQKWWKECLAKIWPSYIAIVINIFVVFVYAILQSHIYDNLEQLLFLLILVWGVIAIILALKQRSFVRPIWSIVTWNLASISFLKAIFMKRKKRKNSIKAIEL